MSILHDDTLGTDDSDWDWPRCTEVWFNRERGQWEAATGYGDNRKHLGFHDTRDDADKAVARHAA